MKIKTLIQKNNERRKCLHDENAAYYEDLLVYIRSSILKDEQATEEVLLELLEHLIAAQHDGKHAEDVFGKKPKELADDILETLPNEKPSITFTFMLETALQFLGIFILITGIPLLFSDEPQTIHMGSLSLLVGWLVLGLVLIMTYLLKLLKSAAFHEKLKSKKRLWLSGLAIGLFILGGALLRNSVEPFGTAFTISKYTQVIAGALLLLISYLLKKLREAK